MTRLREVEGLYPQLIPCHEQGPRSRIPDRKRKDSVERLQHFCAVPQVEIDEHLGIAGSLKAKAVGLQSATELAVVVDFSVENDHSSPRGIPHGLVARGAEINDRESAVGEADSGLMV